MIYKAGYIYVRIKGQ